MRIMLLLVPLAAAAVPAGAVTNFTTNFDSVVIDTPGFTDFAQVEGWSGGPNGIEVQSQGYAGAPDTGANLVELDSNANSSMFRTIDPGVYTLNFAYSARPGVPSASNGIGVYLDNRLLGSFSGDGTGKTATNWVSVGIAFTAQSAGVLRFSALGTSDSYGGYVDSVGLAGSAPPVPEPGEWAMLAAGLGVAGFAARRRIAR